MDKQKIRKTLLKVYRLFYGCCRFVVVTVMGEEYMKKNEEFKDKVYGKLFKKDSK